MRQHSRTGFVSLVALISLLVLFAVAVPNLCAEEKGPLGKYNFAFKMGAFNTIEGIRNTEAGVYLALEGYGEIKRNIYVGGEIGVGVSLLAGSFTPLEFNVKYAIEPASNLVIDFGTGIAAVGVDDFGIIEDNKAWLFGGQFFTDVSYKIKWFYFGVDGKIQITQNFEERDFGFNNFRYGLKTGVLF